MHPARAARVDDVGETQYLHIYVEPFLESVLSCGSAHRRRGNASIVIPAGLKLTLRIEPKSPLRRTQREQDQILVVIPGRVAVQACL